jgi:hypothetical protein
MIVPARSNQRPFRCRYALFRAVCAGRSVATAQSRSSRDTIGSARSRIAGRLSAPAVSTASWTKTDTRSFEPQYRIVDGYKFGFAQVDVDGKSGLIDRDGKMVIEPKYGFIEAIAPGRFRVFEHRQLNGTIGSENFSGIRTAFLASGGDPISGSRLGLDFAGTALSTSPDNGSSCRAGHARSVRTIHRSVGSKEISCGGWRGPTGAGWSNQRSSRQIL